MTFLSEKAAAFKEEFGKQIKAAEEALTDQTEAFQTDYTAKVDAFQTDFSQQLQTFETEIAEQAQAARASFAAIVEQATLGMIVAEPTAVPLVSEELAATVFKPHHLQPNQGFARRRPEPDRCVAARHKRQ